MSNVTIYLKADRNIEVTKPEVSIGDVMQVSCPEPSIVAKVKALRLLRFHHTDHKSKSRTVVSVLKVIDCIQKEYPNVEIQNMGEQDFIVTYEEQKTAGKLFHLCKVTGVVVTSFIGAAFSIMTFNNDVDTSRLFHQIYELLTGSPSDGFTILELTYSIGLTIGILVFFNHFGKKNLTVDPTPMEVEMRLYENDIQTTLIEDFARKEKELDVDK